jgi:hypothetical protein
MFEWPFLAFANIKPPLKKNVGKTTLPTLCVKSSLPYIPVEVMTLAHANKVVTPLYY